MKDDLVKLFTGDEVTVNHIKHELEAAGINCLIKDEFRQGLAAGFGSGVPSAIDVYTLEKDVRKATEMIKALTEE